MKKQILLTTNNVKTIKSLKINDVETDLPFLTYILYMSPFKANSKGINVCSHASKGCADSCLVGSGFGGMFDNVNKGRVAKTEYFLRDRVGFLFQLKDEIEKAIIKHKDKVILTFRLNGTSDLPYEKYKVFEGGKNIFEVFENVQFYDYTKNYTRFNKPLPKNYHLTFSRSESNDSIAMDLLSKGFNVAMVFDKLVNTYKGYKVIDGDISDLRHLDEKNVIVGLKYKRMTKKGANNNLAFDSGFAIRTEKILELSVV